MDIRTPTLSALARVALLAGCLSSAGCARTLRMVGEDQTMGPISVFDDVTLARVAHACGQLPAPSRERVQNRVSSTDHRVGRAPIAACDLLRLFNGARDALAASEQSVSDERTARRYFMYGAALSDVFCATWFAQLDGARRTSRQAHDMLSGVGTLTTAIQSFTSVETSAIGITSAAFAASSDAFDRLDANYMLSPNLVTVNQSLFAFRERYYRQMIEADLMQDAPSAYRYLRQYESTCTSLGVQYFIDSSLTSAGRGERVPTPQTVPPAIAGEIEALRHVISNDLGAGVIISADALTMIVARWIVIPERAPAADASAQEAAAYQARITRVEDALKAVPISPTSRRSAFDALHELEAQGRLARLLDRIRNSPARTDLHDRAVAYLAAGDADAGEEDEDPPAQ